MGWHAYAVGLNVSTVQHSKYIIGGELPRYANAPRRPYNRLNNHDSKYLEDAWAPRPAYGEGSRILRDRDRIQASVV